MHDKIRVINTFLPAPTVYSARAQQQKCDQRNTPPLYAWTKILSCLDQLWKQEILDLIYGSNKAFLIIIS